jgi:SAM-dependent methyltransferase
MQLTSMRSVLFVSHSQQNCGVYQFGKRIAQALSKSLKYRFVYCEVDRQDSLCTAIAAEKPVAIIYNYYPSTMPWLRSSFIRKIQVPQIGVLHEVTQSIADHADNSLFDYHIAPDPTLILRNRIVFKTGRLVANYENVSNSPLLPTIGSFGFGTDGKGLEYLVAAVQESYEEAVIRLHLPAAAFGDPNGDHAKRIVHRCNQLLYKPAVRIESRHDFLEESDLLSFLAGNTCNAFVYNNVLGRGISSVIDYALGVNRPIAIRRTTMMRHLHCVDPSICLEDRSLREIIDSGLAPVQHLRDEWSEQNLIFDYERIVDSVSATAMPRRRTRFQNLCVLGANHIGFGLLKAGGIKSTLKAEWVAGGSIDNDTVVRRRVSYTPITLRTGMLLNRILNDEARFQYSAAICCLFQLVPDLMARKIPEANIQQAFAFDTVHRLTGAVGNASRLLCVGAFEDSAATALVRQGLNVTCIDPILNYDLKTFCEHPSTALEGFDVVFSVSVIEHVEDDESFLVQIQSLVRPGGYILLTCDFQNGYVEGMPKPSCNRRFYTEQSLKDLLERALPNCSLVGESDWRSNENEFRWEGCQYSFAAVVLQKR